MTEPKRGPGRPRITPEERRVNADRSFRHSREELPNGCITSNLKLIRGYDGEPLRPRRFAWHVYTGKAPEDGNVVGLCKTPNCVSRYHISVWGRLPELQEALPEVLWRNHYDWLVYNLERWGIDAAYNKYCRKLMIDQLRELHARRPVEFGNNQETTDRLALMEKYEPGPHPLTDRRVADLALSWGLEISILPS